MFFFNCLSCCYVKSMFYVIALRDIPTSTMYCCLSIFIFFILQEGLILGESKFEEQVTISDTQADHIQIEEIYSKLKLIRSSATKWHNNECICSFFRYPTASPYLQT